MLRHEILTNFVHFQKHHKLDYQAGCNFFIGQNCSGKSSVVEGVRRCLSLTQNTSMSAPHATEKSSAATCLFTIENDKDYLFSSTLRLPETHKVVWVKIVCYQQATAIDLIKEIGAKTLVNKQINDKTKINKVAESVSNFLKFVTSPKEDSLSDIFKNIREIFIDDVNEFIEDNGITEITPSECERYLQKYVDESTVHTFPGRGIGPCQWSKSPKVVNKDKETNYKEAQERSEILKWFFTDKSLSEADKGRVKRYFDIITNHSGIIFDINEKGEIIAYNKQNGKRKRDEDSSSHFPLLKVSDGFYEAMISSIMLGVSSFKTIGLEEPERGMHPQMIERMRDLLLREIHDKTILISSHHPHFLAPWTIPRLFICRRSDSDGIAFEVIQGSKIGEEDEEYSKTPRIITSEHFVSIFYAKRVMFVEGEGDYLFLQAMKHIFLTHDDVIGWKDKKEEFRKFLCSLNIIKLGGETLKLRFKNLCDGLKIKWIFVLDKDAILDDKKTPKRFLKQFNLLSCDSEKVNANPSELEKFGLFVWKKAIEDALMELGNRDADLKKIMKENHVELKYKEATKPNNRYKLFRQKEVTDVNINTVVLDVLKCCLKYKGDENRSEMLRFVDFLFSYSERECTIESECDDH